MKPRLVLDAWAILALLQGEEPAATRVRRLLEEATMAAHEVFMSIVNLGEVYYRIGRARGEDQAKGTMDDIRRLPVTFLPADEEAVFAAAGLKVRYTISYADAFAAAATLAHDATLVTGDPELQQLGQRLKLERLERRR